MFQGINLETIRSTEAINSNFLPASKPVSGQNFRDILSGLKQSFATPAISSGSQRDKIMDAINQARSLTPAAFAPTLPGRQTGPFSIRDYYTMPPEEVKPMLKQLEEELFFKTDFSDMTGIEIYDFIETRFAETFGENFIMANHLLWGPYSGGSNLNETDILTTNFAYITIGQYFYGTVNSLTRHLRCSDTPVTEINRTRLYGNMSNSEIMDAIIANHPQPLTNRSIALMNGELYSVGLNGLDMGRYVAAHTMNPGECVTKETMPHWTELEKRWTRLLDRPANIPLLSAIHNVHLKEARNHAPSLPFAMQTKDMLVKLGAPLGQGGYFLHKLSKEQLLQLFGIGEDYSPGSVEVEMKRDVIDDFLETLERHDKKLRDSRERYERNREVKEGGEKMSERVTVNVNPMGSEV